jgi:hypothetical protein
MKKFLWTLLLVPTVLITQINWPLSSGTGQVATVVWCRTLAVSRWSSGAGFLVVGNGKLIACKWSMNAEPDVIAGTHRRVRDGRRYG